MFASGQTFVCVQANSCLAIGKHGNGASIAPRNVLYGSSSDAI